MTEVNQQRIADKLNISRATVSRCFTNHPAINPTTRAKVFQVAAEIGYKHMETRVPRSKRSNKKVSVCVLICTDKEEYFHGEYESPGAQILAGVTESLQLHDATMEVHFVHPDTTSLDDPDIQKIASLTKRKTSGVLLIYPFAENIIAELAPRFPLVSLVDQLEHNSIDCVDVDHYNGISAILDHLIELGHKRIGFYTRSYAVEAGWSYRRYSAFIEKMARLKLPVAHTDLIGMFPRSEKTLEQSIDEVAERTRQGVTAWVCAADHQAFDMIQGLKNRGLNVPKDVSVTGFDGIKKPGTIPTLTTVEIPYREIGITGTERLIARQRKRFHESQHVYISGNINLGKTSAKPPKT